MPGLFLYDYARNNFGLRLQNNNGGDLWIIAVFGKIAPEEMNRWNRQTHLTRVVPIRGFGEETATLEAQLDCLGGVTDGMVRQFITGFDKEVAGFSAFLRNIVKEEEEFKNLTAARLESTFP